MFLSFLSIIQTFLFFFVSYVSSMFYISFSHMKERHQKALEYTLLSNGWDLFYLFCLFVDLTVIIRWVMWLILILFWDSLFKS